MAHVSFIETSPSPIKRQSIIKSQPATMKSASIKPEPLNVTFCDHEAVFDRPDLIRSVTPPPSLSPTKGQLKRFEFTENFANKSVDDTAVSFIKAYKKQLKLEKQQREQQVSYEQKLKNSQSKFKENKAIPINMSKSLHFSPQKPIQSRMSIKLQQICKTKVIPKVRRRKTLTIPSLPLHKINRTNLEDSLYEDNRFAIGWNFLNSVTKRTLLSDNTDSGNIDRLKSFMSYSSMILTFNHYTRRWQTSEDIRKLSTMTTNRYRKEGIDIAATIVDKNDLNMNLFVREYPNISGKRFKKSLRTAYQILDNRPDTVRTTLHAIPIFLPSLNIVFDPSKRQLRKEKEESEHTKKMQRKKHLLNKKKEKLQKLKSKLDRVRMYKKDLKKWERNKEVNDITTPFITMMSFDKNSDEYKNVVKNSKLIKKNKFKKSVIESNVKINKF